MFYRATSVGAPRSPVLDWVR